MSGWDCKICGYAEEAQRAECRAASHRATKVRLTKRFFVCAQCKRERAHALGSAWPTKPCKRCGCATWERAGMGQNAAKGPAILPEFMPTGAAVEQFLRGGM